MNFFKRIKTDIASGLSHLHASYKEITHAVALARSAPRTAANNPSPVLKMALQGMTRLVDQACETLGAISRQQVGKTEQVRQFMEDRGICRDVQTPNIVVTVFVLTLCVLIEGGMSAALFFAGGKADLFLSLAYGFSVAWINVSAAAIAGFIFGRAIGFKIDAIEPKLRDFLIRLGGWMGLLTVIAAMLLLGFAAARVRVTAAPIDIFNFTEVSFAATFADYYGILLIVLGILGGIVAIREGWVGLSDPIIGYSKIWKQAESELRETAHDVRDFAQDALEDIYEDLSEQLEDDLDELRDYAESHRTDTADLIGRITGHNLDVEAAKEAARNEHVRDVARKERIKGEPIKTTEFDTGPYEALVIAEPSLPPTKGMEAKIAALSEAKQNLDVTYHQSMAALEQAYAGFLAGVSGLDITDDEKEKTDVDE